MPKAAGPFDAEGAAQAAARASAKSCALISGAARRVRIEADAVENRMRDMRASLERRWKYVRRGEGPRWRHPINGGCSRNA